MDNNNLETTLKNERKDERGAALVTVLLISFLLVGAAIGLILSVSLNTANVTDATAEQQAYYAAESGIQSAVNVLRENVTPNPLLNPGPSPLPTDNEIDYLKAIKIASSNATSPTAGNCASSTPSLDCRARLSRWLSYTGGVVPIGTNSRMSFAVEVSDPDNIGDLVTYRASGSIEGAINGVRTFTAPGNPARFVTIRYVPPAGDITVSVAGGGSSVTEFGRFEITGSALGSVDITIPRVRFVINVNMVQPFNTVKTIRGSIDPGTIDMGSSGTVRLFYDSQAYLVQSSTIALTPPSGPCNANGTGSPGCGVLIDPNPPVRLLPEGYYRSGFSVIPNPPSSTTTPGVTPVSGTISAPEPVRLLIRSTGYGPNGAKKQLEAIIQKNYFNGLGAPSPLTLIGAPCTNTGGTAGCIARPTSSTFRFAPGNSTPIVYSGKDSLLRAFLPPVGVTNNTNLASVNTAVAGMNGRVEGVSSNVADELPYWLQTPANLDATVQLLKSTAQASGKYYAPGVTPPSNPSGSGNYGDYATGTGITFVDGDLTLRNEGGGILIVTGKLNFNGGFAWKGLVLITGEGGFERSGGGNGNLGGTMIVAPYNAQSLACSPNTLDCFLSPRYEISGGGVSTLEYNSTNVANGLSALSNFVKGVAEK